VEISIIIVTFNSLDPLKACLKSIGGQEGVAFETIVVDNKSSDGTGEFLGTQNVRRILPEKNEGFGAGVNLGQALAAGRYLFILNPDTILPPFTLKALHSFAVRADNFGLISPLIVWPNGSIQPSARKLPTRFDFLFGRGSPLFKLGITGENRAGYIRTEDEYPAAVPAVSATALFIETALFRSLDGFDRRFFMYLEDIDLCRRISEKNLTIWLLPAVRVIHGWRQSSKMRPYFSAFHHHRSVFQYFAKYYPTQFIQNLLLAAALVVGFILSSALIFTGLRRDS
jgi:GT2 family glycosyltransferase